MIDTEGPIPDPAKQGLRDAFMSTLQNAPHTLSPHGTKMKGLVEIAANNSPPFESPEDKLPTGFAPTDDGLFLVHSPCGKNLPIPEGTGSYGVSQIAWAHTCGQS